MKTISFIIPCYNEEEVIKELYNRLNLVSNTLLEMNYKSEFLFINDGRKIKQKEL